MTKDRIDGSTGIAPTSEVKLDGSFDDALWSKAKLFLYSGSSVKVRWVWTDKGCYLGFDVTDDHVVTSGQKPFENSSVEVYLDYQKNGGNPDEKDRTILVDAAGNMLFRKGVDGKYIDFGSANIQSGTKKTDSGYAIELYIPWAEFDAGKPTEMGVAFGQVMRWEGEEGTRWFNDGLCSDPQNPSLYSIFTEQQIGSNYQESIGE